ncbi:MAG: hypothetical protein LVQ95_01270 [Candidatus Micrarchaeales archaeon]|nr:hypothetical protein [Candidatus Micrarchaeales archaeon]
MSKRDALALFKKNPKDLLSALLPRERVLIGIMASKAAPMPIEQIKAIYIRLAFDNVTGSLKLLRYANLALEAYNLIENTPAQKAKILRLKQELEEIRSSFSTLGGPREEAITAISKVFFPKRVKVPLLISQVTIKNMLEEMMNTYSSLIETRQSGERLHYYLNVNFAELWHDRNMEALKKTAPWLRSTMSKEEIEFFVQANNLLKIRIEFIETHTTGLLNVAETPNSSSAKNVRQGMGDGLAAMGFTKSTQSAPADFLPILIPMDSEVGEFLESVLEVADWDLIKRASKAAEKSTTEERLSYIERMLPKGYRVVKEK